MSHVVTSASDSTGQPKGLWIAAHEHRRTIGLCREWPIALVLLSPGRAGRRLWVRRIIAALGQFRRRRPEIVFVANPSLVLTTFAWLMRPIFGYLLVVDAHNEGIRPFDRPYALVRWLTRRLLSGADVTLVSNAALAADVEAAGGRPLVLSDRLPEPPERPALRGPEWGDDPSGPSAGRPAARPADDVWGPRPDVVVIATFRRDEPIAEIVSAATSLRETEFAFTGRASAFRRLGIELPPNVRLTDYLPDDEYWATLAAARVICDLTLKQDCLVCGAYEALALGKPMVLTDDPATREIFGPAAVLARNDVDSIAAAINDALARSEALASAAKVVRDQYRIRWGGAADAIWREIVAAREASVGARAA